MTKKHGKKHENDAQPIDAQMPESECGEQTADAQSSGHHTVKVEVHTESPAAGQQSGAKAGTAAAHGAEPVQSSESGTEAKAEAADAEKNAQLEAKCRELQDQYLRKAADFDNYRKRMIKEKQEAIDYANTNLLSDLLQILDDFDRAIEAGQKAEAENTEAFMQGVLMIRSGLLSLLGSKYGLQYYEVQGKVFDPAIHEAVATNPSAEVTEPTVGAELQKGYKLKERVLRPAKVMVLMPAQTDTK